MSIGQELRDRQGDIISRALVEAVCGRLDAIGVSHALIGGWAMLVHEVARLTFDIDLLAVDETIFSPALWSDLTEAGFNVDVRRGDVADALTGVVHVDGVGEPSVTVADLILLKLYAGSALDRRDVLLLLESERAHRVAEVDARIDRLPPRAQKLWARMREE